MNSKVFKVGKEKSDFDCVALDDNAKKIGGGGHALASTALRE